jgi:uncharacterized protein (TIGR01777 family)
MKKIVIAGGSGYLGRLAAEAFLSDGYEVITLARKNFRGLKSGEKCELWDAKSAGPWEQALAGADVLLNLAGRTVNCRYTRKNRQEILSSRVLSTVALGEAIARLPENQRPKVWLNASTATIYRHALDRAQDEETGEIGKGFSVEIAKAWEGAFLKYKNLGTRMVALRMAMVFGKGKGGVYEAYRNIVKMGLGGRAGSGEQYVSWLHAADYVGMLLWIVENARLEGAVNLASPEPRPNGEFMRVLRRSLKASFALPAPDWMLEIGAIFLRTETELLLKSRRVIPQRLLKSGYRMKYPKLEAALQDLAN